MAQASLAMMCPNPSPDTFSWLTECSVHEKNLLPSSYDQAIFLFSLFSFCLALTCTVLKGFQLVCFLFSKIHQAIIIDARHLDDKHSRYKSSSSKSTLKSSTMSSSLSPSDLLSSADESDLSDAMSVSLDNMSDAGNEADIESTDHQDAGAGAETRSNDAAALAAEFSAQSSSRSSSSSSGICAYCLDEIHDGDLIKPCTKCRRVCCPECMRAIFILACRDESSMPPRCCRRPIHLVYGRLVLARDEVDWFKEKYDEWGTVERCYCPVPSCSAFLNPRRFPEFRARVQKADDQENSVYMTMTMTDSRSEMSHPDAQYADAPPARRPVIHCPKCNTSICTQCMQQSHDDDDDDDDDNRTCTRDDDMPPELAAALLSMRAKRCPKCRTAVCKSYGCSHMRCRCGAKWCWYCFRTIEQCEAEQCVVAVEGPDLHDESYSDYDDDDDDDDDDDNDGDGGLEDMIVLRPEHHVPSPVLEERIAASSTPYPVTASEADRRTEEEYRVIPFNCLHHWYPVEGFESDASLVYNCERCWGVVYARLNLNANDSPPLPSPLPREREYVVDGEEKLEYDTLQDNTMLRCWVCSQVVCNRCRRRGF